MRKLHRLLGLVALLSLSAATAARADGFKSWNVCGGNSFNTCASVQLDVVGTTVTMRVWNLSGLSGSYASTVFTGVGIFNVPAGVQATGGLLGMSGPVRGTDTPANWIISNNTQIGGGINLTLVGTTGSGVKNGIASNCAPAGTLPGGSNNFWMNPTCGTTGVTDPTLNGGFVVFSFTVTQTWDPNAAGTELLVKGQNGPNGLSTECITGPNGNCGPNVPPPPPPPPPQVVPEPITMTLLGTGLIGLGGAGLRRRRKQAADLEKAE